MCGNGSGTKQQGLSKVFNQIRISIHNSVSPIYQMYISNNVSIERFFYIPIINILIRMRIKLRV